MSMIGFMFHLFGQFPWLESIDTLLLGLWKAFYYSGKNCNILRSLQEAYGIKALNLLNAVVTRWLSHGAAFKRCRERYNIIIEALDIISTTNNLELVTYRNILLDTETVYQITFLEDVLIVTNILSLLLQSDIKDFTVIARSVNTVPAILKNIGENTDTSHLKNFNNTNEIIEKIEFYKRKNIVSSGMRKHQKQDHNLTKDIFHKKVIKPFIDELIKEIKNAFDISHLPVLNAFLKLDPQKIPNKDSLLFENYGMEEVTLFHNFYGKGKKQLSREDSSSGCLI